MCPFDFITTPQRSNLMSKIKSSGTRPERLFRKALWKEGFRYRLNDKRLPGKPDIYIPSVKLVVFIDGEFWHGYKWKTKKEKIKANRDYWIKKIERNIERDKKNNKELRKLGYTVMRFWEHQIKNNDELCVLKVINAIK